jgi:signal transduction histidine kinase
MTSGKEIENQDRSRRWIGIRGRIYFLLGLLVLVTSTGGAATLWYSYRMESLLEGVIQKDLAAFQTAAALETALVNQKGFVSYFFLDRDPKWLHQLGIYREVFRERLEEAWKQAGTPEAEEILTKLSEEYTVYIRGKDQVIDLYRSGQRETGARLHAQIRSRFFRILELSEEYRQLHNHRIDDAQKESHKQLIHARIATACTILFDVVLAVVMIVFLLKQILEPIHRLALETSPAGCVPEKGDDVMTLSRSVHGMMKDIDDTHVALEKSRETLLQAEKMAVVGKLAAGMAHSIRNPFTSVKMRLFSLSRSLKLNPEQEEDFDVVTDEIRHIDTIVQNFLEFSRPPKLQVRTISPSQVVDMTLQLLEHRLKAYDVSVKVVRPGPLPEIDGDPEQLKEVLVNLIINACEAMGRGGHITIREVQKNPGQKGAAAVIRVEDSGPGMPASVKEKIFLPFYTTKEEGTGLGLSIAARIMEEHGGTLAVESKEGRGAVFILTFPAKEPA